MDASVWTNSMCNELGGLSQGWGKHAGTDTIEFIFHKYKLKYIREYYLRVVCDTRTHKKETYRTILAAGGNLMDYSG